MGLFTSRTSISEALFFGVQQRVLGLFFGQPGRSFHGNEVMHLTHSGKGGLQRELRRLTDSGLLTVTALGNQKRYQANAASPIFEELCSIVQKTFGFAYLLREALRPLEGRISLAFVYGEAARPAQASTGAIELLVLSETLTYPEVIATLEAIEGRLGREVVAALYTPTTFETRRTGGSTFVQGLLGQPKLFLIGAEADLRAKGG